MALRSGYKGFKKLLPGLKLFRPGTLGIDNDVLIPELNKTFFPRSEQAVLGAKNVFDYSKAASSANTAYTATNNGKNINLTSITNGTYRSIIFNFNVNKNTEYRLSTNVTITSGHAGIKIQQTDSTAIKTESITSSGEKTFTFNSGNNEVLQMVLFCTWSTSEAGNVDYNDLIIQLASDPDPTYAPFAMTNKELTDMFVTESVKDDLTPFSDITIDEATFARCGYICAYSFKLTATGEITAPKALITAGLKGPNPMVDMIANAVFKDTSGNQYSLSFTSTSGENKLVTNTAMPNGTSIRGTIVFIRSVLS